MDADFFFFLIPNDFFIFFNLLFTDESDAKLLVDRLLCSLGLAGGRGAENRLKADAILGDVVDFFDFEVCTTEVFWVITRSG